MQNKKANLSPPATILIVEDSITQAEKLKYILEENGFVVKHALNGRQALLLLDKYKPTLIISDIVMPEMNGYELCKHIKANKGTRGIPVFLMTALSASEDVLVALSCGADSFITKPYSEKYILEHIENFLEQKNMNSEDQQNLIKNRSELFQISSNEPNRMISLMLSIYEAAVYRNYELIQTQDELVSLNENLENLVIEKASELSAEISTRVWMLEKDIAERKQAEKALNDQKERYRILTETSMDGFFVLDLSGALIEVNEAYCKISGYSRDLLLSMNLKDIDANESPDNTRMRINEIIKIGWERFESMHRRADGSLINVLNSVTYFPDKGLLLCFISNITEQKQAEKFMMESEKKFRTYTEKAPYGILITDLSGKIIESNETACQISGYSQDELEDKSLYDLISSDSHETGSNHLKIIESKGVADIEIRGQKKNGYKYWINLISAKIGDDKIISFCNDISNRKIAEERLIYANNHDFLTTLYNRTYFENELIILDTEKNLPLSIINFDVNGLKMINDSFGRAKGDECLIKIAKIIRNELPSAYVLARISGGEFGVILPNTDIKSSEQAINKMMDLTKGIEESIYYLTVSFGCYSKTDKNQNIQGILTLAENDMHKHKLYEESSTRRNVINIIMKTLFEKSEREMLHSERVSKMCGEIAFHMNFDKNEINKIRTAGLIHDIGKIGIEEKILNKKTKLDQEEWQEIKKHPEIGWRILRSTTEFSELAQTILEHHERWDGKGYPKGMKEHDISKEARIISLADSYDAMTNDRSYRNFLTKTEAIAEIIKCSGTQFDPEIANIFIQNVLMEK